MPKFSYKAKDGPGRTIEGEVEASSRDEAAAAVDALGYSPISVERKEGDPPASAGFYGDRVRSRDVTVFTRQLASLIKSGVPILQALRTVRDQTPAGRLRRIVGELEESVRDGRMLSVGMARHPAIFPELYVNMVRSGESGGVLDAILQRLADAREKEEDIRRKVQSALAYPTLVIVMGVLTVVVLLTFFMPRIAALFPDPTHLPLPTRILIGISQLFTGSGWWLLLPIVLAAAVLRRMTAGETGRRMLDRFRLKLPIVGRVIHESEIARFARTLALLVEAGIPIDRALELSAHTLQNSVLHDEVMEVRRMTVQQGRTLSSGLRQSALFPAFVSNMMAVGEEAGRLEESLNEIATFYEKEVEQQTRLATTLLEPALILIVGGVVGFIVAAMLLPIFQLGAIR